MHRHRCCERKHCCSCELMQVRACILLRPTDSAVDLEDLETNVET